MSYEYLAEKMVQEQLFSRGIRDKAVLRAFLQVPRHHFVDEALAERSYGEHPLPIGNDQTISSPFVQAYSLEMLELTPESHVLEVGMGSGYQTAILAEIATEVSAIERDGELFIAARGKLEALGYYRIHLKHGDGTRGWEQYAPYDGIVVAATGPSIPMPLYEQLRDGGRMVVPIEENGEQRLKLVVKDEASGPKVVDKGPCVFVPLVGEHGYGKGKRPPRRNS